MRTKHDLTVHYAHPLQLTLHPRNARKGVVPKIKESLKRFGQYRPITVNQRTNHVIVGNHTLKAILELNWDEVAYVNVDVDEDTEIRMLLADNRLADLGGYDASIEVDLLQDLGGDFTGTGYDQDYLDDLIAEMTADPDEDAEPEIETSHKVIRFGVVIDCADRIEQMALLAKLDKLGITGKPLA